jgi:hypothetical protein
MSIIHLKTTTMCLVAMTTPHSRVAAFWYDLSRRSFG